MTAPAIAFRLLALAAGVFGVSATVAAPIHADMLGNAFLNALNNAGVPYSEPSTAVAFGRTVCPKALSPGGSFDAIVSEMAQLNGLPRDRAAAFTIVAIATYCPALIAPMLPHRLQA